MVRYYIYSLADPRDNSVKYVGMTCDIARREAQHRRPSLKSLVGRWVAELHALGLSPVVNVIEVVDNCKLTAFARESYWMKHHHAECPLLNRQQLILGKRSQMLLAKCNETPGSSPVGNDAAGTS